jgi:hypothetical protein
VAPTSPIWRIKPTHPTPGDGEAFAPELPPYFSRPVHLKMLVPYATNLAPQIVIATGAR